jgi:hypothetical protein
MLLTERKSLYSSSDTSSGDEDGDASESSKSGEFPHFVFCRDEAMNKIIPCSWHPVSPGINDCEDKNKLFSNPCYTY